MNYLFTKNGSKVVVDDEVYQELSQYRWSVLKNGYVVRTNKKKNSPYPLGTLYIHRVIMGPQKGKYVDHINGDKLDNRRENLRVCSPAESICNRQLGKNNKSGFKGVSFNLKVGKWQAFIQVSRKNKYLGLFENPKEAAKAYNKAATDYHGEFAYLNNV